MKRLIRYALFAVTIAASACSIHGGWVPQPTTALQLALEPDHTFTIFPVPSPNPFPWFSAAGSDGNVWFTDLKRHVIGRVTSSGVITEFKLNAGVKEFGITPGAPGTLWFADDSKIGEITTAGAVTEFTLPSGDCAVAELVFGPDGNVWFTDYCSNSIGKMTTTGVVTDFSLPTFTAAPFDIKVGPDDNMWFTEQTGDRIGRITAQGAITEFQIPSQLGLGGITVAPDGNLYAVANQFATSRIERITTTGSITEFGLRNGPAGFVTADRRGRLWIEYAHGKFGTFNITTHSTSPLFSAPNAIRVNNLVLGPDGDIWFAAGAGYIGVIE